MYVCVNVFACASVSICLCICVYMCSNVHIMIICMYCTWITMQYSIVIVYVHTCIWVQSLQCNVWCHCNILLNNYSVCTYMASLCTCIMYYVIAIFIIVYVHIWHHTLCTCIMYYVIAIFFLMCMYIYDITHYVLCIMHCSDCTHCNILLNNYSVCTYMASHIMYMYYVLCDCNIHYSVCTYMASHIMYYVHR